MPNDESRLTCIYFVKARIFFFDLNFVISEQYFNFILQILVDIMLSFKAKYLTTFLVNFHWIDPDRVVLAIKPFILPYSILNRFNP